MPANSSKTPASMIMAGILQVRQAAINCYENTNYYLSAQLYWQSAALLPVEAKKTLKLDPPPSAGDKNAMTPELSLAARQWIEKYAAHINEQISVYVYGYFERGRQMKQGY